MINTSIFSAQSKDLRKLFEQAGHRSKVLCAPLDYAKKQHTVLFCNGHGDILKKPFSVDNSPAGLKFLLDQLQHTLTGRHLQAKHVFFGGEDIPAYAENFITQLRQKGYLVAQVNAWEAKKRRENFQASNDHLDLTAIAKLLLDWRGNVAPAAHGTYRSLRELSRTRRRVVRDKTALSNRIHTYVDRLFPGFLDVAQSGLAPFSKASLALMSERFSAPQIRRRRRPSLSHQLQRHGVEKADEVASQLQQLAAQVLEPASEHVSVWQVSLQQQVLLYNATQAACHALEAEVAHWLALTPGAFLTSIRGIGVTLAAGLSAELGDPNRLRRLACLCSYAGIIPGSKQTGGPQSPAHTTGVKPRCNRILKDWAVQASVKIGQCGPPELKAAYLALEAQEQHAQFIMAKRLLRLCKCLLRTQSIYRPSHLLAADTPRGKLAAYYLELWPALLTKWKGTCDLRHVFAAQHPLGGWRLMVQDLYGLALPLPKETTMTPD